MKRVYVMNTSIYNKYNRIIDKNLSVSKIGNGLELGKYPFSNLHLFLKKINNDYFMGVGQRISELYIHLVYTHVELNDHPLEYKGSVGDMFSFIRNSCYSMCKYRGVPQSATVKRYISNISLCMLPYVSHDAHDIAEKYKAFSLYKLYEAKLKLIGKKAQKRDIAQLHAMTEYVDQLPYIIPYDLVTEKGVIVEEFGIINEFDIALKQNFQEVFKSIKREIFSVIPSDKDEYKSNTNKTWIKLCISENFLRNFMPDFTKEDLSRNFLHIFSNGKKEHTANNTVRSSLSQNSL